MKKNFLVDHIDPLSQGVSKINNPDIDFIMKTLPGEAGSAYFYKKNKQLSFGVLESPSDLIPETISSNRVTPNCPHYYSCTACHFLHTDYANELNLKAGTVNFLARKITSLFTPNLKIEIIPAINRSYYRNRIQLHYDISKKKLGFINVATNTITPVPNCLLPNSKILTKIKELYAGDSWIKLISANTNIKKGHIELYEIDPNQKEVQVSFNLGYSEGGFSQVNPEMNSLFLQLIHKMKEKWIDPISDYWVIDLFGGDGNIGKNFLPKAVFSIDSFNLTHKKSNKNNNLSFIQDDLYKTDNFYKWQNFIFSKVDVAIKPVLILDPPRSGFNLLNNWVKTYDPVFIFYISCNFHTLVRDLDNLKNYQIVEFLVIDFFPSTYHFETLIILRKTI
ncbi:MAG: hypothetical protein U0T83_02070 [Bacteriovoracaceae bacterium]